MVVVTATTAASARGQLTPYNPYAPVEEVPPPVSSEGTIQWGTFYKSAALQAKYERLWELGACRGTSKAIMGQVEANKVAIDRLPDANFRGTVVGMAGTQAGGVVAFVEATAHPHAGPPLVAQFHPAGVTRFTVSGQATVDVVRPGMTLRLLTTVDDRGRATDPVKTIDIITPPADFQPSPVVEGKPGTVVGTVMHFKRGILSLRVHSGSIRKLVIPLADDATASIEASLPELVTAGDAIEVKGKCWSGAGAMGAGTVFASQVLVRKAVADGSQEAP